MLRANRRIGDTDDLQLMAGEAEQVTPVVHEFVHVNALDDRGGAFFGADEINCEA